MDIEQIIHLVFSVLAIFTVIIIITRLFGLRTFAKMSSFDFASTIAVGSVLASIILNTDYSLLKGAIVLFTIIAFQTLFSFIVRKSKWLRNLFTNNPRFLIWEGNIIKKNLERCNIGEDDLMAKLREANVYKLEEVKAVVFESTGDISVVHSKEDVSIDDCIFMGVDIKNI